MEVDDRKVHRRFAAALNLGTPGPVYRVQADSYLLKRKKIEFLTERKKAAGG